MTALTINVVVNYSGGLVDSNVFQLGTVDALPPSQIMGLTVAAGASANLISFEPAADAYSVASTGLGSYVIDKDAVPLIALPQTAHTVNANLVGADVGAVGAAGSSVVDATGFGWTIKGAGADIFGTVDAFQYLNAPWTGDGMLRGVVTSFAAGAAQFAKFGLMFRESLAANASLVAIYYQASVGNVVFHVRNGTGTTTVQEIVGPSVTLPIALKLVSVANVYTAFYSSDGNNWVELGTAQTVAMAASRFGGVACCSLAAGTLATGVMSNVTLLNMPSISYSDSAVAPGASHTYDVKGLDLAVPTNTGLKSASVIAVTPTGASSAFGIKNTNGTLTNLQGVKMPLYVVCVSGLETMHGSGSRVAGFPAATQAQWAQALTSWGPSKGRNIMAQPTALRFQLISSYWNGDTGTDGPLTDSASWYTGGKPGMSAATYQAAVIQTITRATAAGWICILSLCIDSITEPNGTVHLGLGQPCAPGPTGVRFWGSVAAAFKNNPAVVFEAFNEAILSNQFSSSGGFGWYGGGGNGANNQPYGGPTLPGPDAIAYLNATSASTVFTPPAGCTMMNNSANSSALVKVSTSMKLAGIKEILATIAAAGAPNLVAIGVPGFAGGLDDWLGLGITDPRGNNQIAAAYHAYGQGHVQSMRLLQTAGIPMIMTEADGGDFAASGFSYKEIYNAGLGYSAGSNGWNNWGAGPNIMTGGASPLTAAPENQGMPVPNGSN